MTATIVSAALTALACCVLARTGSAALSAHHRAVWRARVDGLRALECAFRDVALILATEHELGQHVTPWSSAQEQLRVAYIHHARLDEEITV